MCKLAPSSKQASSPSLSQVSVNTTVSMSSMATLSECSNSVTVNVKLPSSELIASVPSISEKSPLMGISPSRDAPSISITSAIKVEAISSQVPLTSTSMPTLNNVASPLVKMTSVTSKSMVSIPGMKFDSNMFRVITMPLMASIVPSISMSSSVASSPSSSFTRTASNARVASSKLP